MKASDFDGKKGRLTHALRRESDGLVFKKGLLVQCSRLNRAVFVLTILTPKARAQGLKEMFVKTATVLDVVKLEAT